MAKRKISKMLWIYGMIWLYVILAISLKMLAMNGIIQKKTVTSVESDLIDSNGDVGDSLQAAIGYFNANLIRQNGHIDLYKTLNPSLEYPEEDYTNSEAISYYLFWNAELRDKAAFDKVYKFMTEKMIHPQEGFVMWKLSSNDSVVDDGANVASDADLRIISALLIAEREWKDPKYSKMIARISSGLEKVAVTDQKYLAPYGGLSGKDSYWLGKEIWISYEDFTVIQALAVRKGEPWKSVYNNMKSLTIRAQIENGLYNSMLTEAKVMGNGIDNGGYSINSMWILVRAAESGDSELIASARKGLEFYKQRYEEDNGKIYASYASSGDPITDYDAPWVYALLSRAAVALDDFDFSSKMMKKLLSFQVDDRSSPEYGAIIEGTDEIPRVGQFTMQESILSMSAYVKSFE